MFIAILMGKKKSMSFPFNTERSLRTSLTIILMYNINT